jgi:biotin carboxylase
MNLLVTNTRNTQAYVVIRALRPHAQKIIVTIYGKSPLEARLSHAANSRLVDKRYHVPSPVADWRAGRIQRENTEREEAYIQAVERICEKENIDTIFPTWDPKVYVFSKNKERFAKMGVVIPVPDYDALITPLDKYRTIRAAEEVGLPCPKTCLADSDDDLRRIAADIGFPMVIKPRHASGGRGFAIVRDFTELAQSVERLIKKHEKVMIQECIPGQSAQSISLLLDKQGSLKVVSGTENHRSFFRIPQNFSTVSESVEPYPYVALAAKLARNLGWWGCVNVQMKVDARDGVPKLMEINPRLGSRRWSRTEIGINEALMCVKISRDEQVDAVDTLPTRVLRIHPVEDLLGLVFKLLDLCLYRIRIGLLGRTPIDASNPPMPLKKLISAYKDTYLSRKRKIFNPYFTYCLEDPVVSILWFSQFVITVIKGAKQLGR